MPCFRDFDVCSICIGGGCGGIGGASKELLKVGGCVGEYLNEGE